MLDLVDLCDRTGTAIVSVSETVDTSTPFGRMVLQVVGVFAELERGMTSERTAKTLPDCRRQRQVYGAVPFGWRRESPNSKKLVEVPEQQEALAEMRRMAENGATLKAIGGMLESRGLLPRNGGHWQPASVRSILRSKMATEAAA